LPEFVRHSREQSRRSPEQLHGRLQALRCTMKRPDHTVRLECLKVAATTRGDKDVIDEARRLYQFVTEAQDAAVLPDSQSVAEDDIRKAERLGNASRPQRPPHPRLAT
jgi:hypothetical protein